MRIWAFPSFYPLDHPGLKWSGIFAHRQYVGLKENGAEVKVIVPVLWYPPKPFSKLNSNWKMLSRVNYPKERTFEGVQVYHPRIANMKPSRLFNRKQYEERYTQAIVSFFKSNNIQLNKETDIFYSQWIPTGRMVQQAARQLGVKSAMLAIGDDIVVWPHESADKKAAFIKAWKEADLRLAVAAYLADEGNKIVGEVLPYKVVRRGVEHQKFVPAKPGEKERIRQEFNLPADKIIILTVGSALVRKGWLDLFDALAEIVKTNQDILLVGIHSGSKELQLDDEAAKRGLTKYFLNMGEVAPQTINQLYVAADIFCLPSHWEGIANSVVEAMSCGLPVLTTAVCGHPELITSGENGILVEPKQPGQITKELAMLISDRKKRETLGANARNFIVDVWGSFAQNSAKLYKILSS